MYKNRCISVPSVSEKDKHLILIINIIVSITIIVYHIIVFYDQTISLIFLWKMGPKCHPYFVYITAQRQYTAVQKIIILCPVLCFKVYYATFALGRIVNSDLLKKPIKLLIKWLVRLQFDAIILHIMHNASLHVKCWYCAKQIRICTFIRVPPFIYIWCLV